MKRKIFLSAAILLLCIAIAGVMANIKMTDAAPKSAPSAAAENTKLSFSKEEFLADYDRLWEVLEENYYYFPYLEEQGVNIDSLKKSTRQQLENRITDVEGFYYLLEIMFRKMENFAHLGVLAPDGFAVYQKYYNSAEAEENGWRRALQNPQSQAVYEYLAEKHTAGNRKRNEIPDVEVFYDKERNAVTFKIASFDDSICERDRNFIKEYLASLGDARTDHIIFDLSGNGGGSDFYWQKNIVEPFGGNYEWTTWCYLRNTELMRNYFFNDFQPELVSSISGHDVPEEVEEFRLTHYIKATHEISSESELESDVSDAKRWVIIDSRVYSSADTFVAFCRETGWAAVVGQTTRGDGKGVSPILYLLPETGLLIRFSGLAVESSDGELNAIVGTKPDIWAEPSNESVYEIISRGRGQS